MSERSGPCRETEWEKRGVCLDRTVELTVQGYSIPKMLICWKRCLKTERWAGRKKIEDGWDETPEGKGSGAP